MTQTATSTSPETESEVEVPTFERRAALAVRTAFIAAIPGVALFIPAFQRYLAEMASVETEAGSYDPAGALEPYQAQQIGLFLLTVLGLAVVFVAVLLAAASTGVSRLPEDARTDVFVGVALVVGFLTFIVFILVARPAVQEQTPAHAALESRGEQTVTWVEERYGLTIDAATAEALIEERRESGDPVLIEGRLLTLTHIAQGGYVLTEDGSTTEIPTTEETEAR